MEPKLLNGRSSSHWDVPGPGQYIGRRVWSLVSVDKYLFRILMILDCSYVFLYPFAIFSIFWNFYVICMLFVAIFWLFFTFSPFAERLLSVPRWSCIPFLIPMAHGNSFGMICKRNTSFQGKKLHGLLDTVLQASSSGLVMVFSLTLQTSDFVFTEDQHLGSENLSSWSSEVFSVPFGASKVKVFPIVSEMRQRWIHVSPHPVEVVVKVLGNHCLSSRRPPRHVEN